MNTTRSYFFYLAREDGYEKWNRHSFGELAVFEHGKHPTTVGEAWCFRVGADPTRIHKTVGEAWCFAFPTRIHKSLLQKKSIRKLTKKNMT